MSVGDAVTVGSTIYSILSPPIFRQCGYILFCSSHVNDLKHEIQKLKDAAARVQNSVDESRSAGEFIHEDVLTWLNNTEQRIESGNHILEINKVGRFLGCVPNPKACHKLGRDAKKAILDFQKLFSEGVFDKVSYQHIDEQSLIVGASTSSQRNYVALKSRTAVLKFVIEALDDDKIGTIGVYGMGGVGKTTLLKEVENGAKESKKFDEILSVFVSQAPNLTGIRAEIDYRLKRLRSSDASRKTVLILFDDLWKPLDLKDLGVPESNSKLIVKLVMTSRNKHLLADEMSCQRTFSIGVLDMEEAWRFFAVLVSSKIQDLKGKPAAVAFLKKCAGLPVSIEALATLWKKKNMDSFSGDLNEDYLKGAKDLPDGFVSLELSYNSLEDGDVENQAKLVFRIIGLLNTPKVPVLTLIKYMVGLGLFGSSTSYNLVERARMEITRSLRTLQESSLLLESDDSDHVKIHDVVRDVAVGIASREDHALIFDPLKGGNEWPVEKLKECKTAYLTSSAVKELHEGWNSPNLMVFVLEAGDEQEITSFFTQQRPSESIETTIAAVFFNDQKVMQPIKYKAIRSVTHLRLDKLQRIELTDCKNVVHFTDSQVLLKLVNLESLTIEGCESLEDIFDLQGIELDVEILPKLYELKLRELPKLELIWKKNLKQPIKGCRKLRTIEIYKCENLLYLSSSFMCEVMENLTEININSCEKMKTVFLEEEGPESNPSSVKAPLKSLKILMISHCSNLNTFISGNCTTVSTATPSGLNSDSSKLKCSNKAMPYWCYGTKVVEDTSNLQVDTSKSFFNQKVFLPRLENLNLYRAGEFEKLWCGEIPDQSYCNLDYVFVKGCRDLQTVFPASLVERLHNLKRLRVETCDKLETVFGIDAGWKSKNNPKVLMLPRLQEVNLIWLMNLRDIVERDSDDEFVIGLPSLSLLDVEWCHKLINLIPTTTATTLLKLKKLTIEHCNKLEKVISGEGSERYKRTVITFPHLTFIYLFALQSLTCLSSESYRFDFMCLKRLHISYCRSLNTLIEPTSDSLLRSEDEAIATRALFNDEVQLPNLEDLLIIDSEVQELWSKEPRKASSFCKLKILLIDRCRKLENVIPSFMVKRLQNLEYIHVSNSKLVQDIFMNTSTQLTQSAHEESIGESRQAPERSTINFAKLSTIQLGIELDNLWSGSYTLELPSLKELYFYGTKGTTVQAIMEKVTLPNLEELRVKCLSIEITELWHNEPSVGSFSKLKYLEVEECEGLVKIIPGFMVKRLENLEKLVVNKCNNLEIVSELNWLVDVQEDSESKQPACFPYFQNLASIHVGNCRCLKNLFTISEQHLDQYGGTIDSDKMVQLPRLTYMRLVNLPNFSHLFLVMQGQYVLDLTSLKEFFLFEAGDQEY